MKTLKQIKKDLLEDFRRLRNPRFARTAHDDALERFLSSALDQVVDSTYEAVKVKKGTWEGPVSNAVANEQQENYYNFINKKKQ